jgi:hypothetical protein
VGKQEARWEGGGSEPSGEYIFFCRKGNETHELFKGFCVQENDIRSYEG